MNELSFLGQPGVSVKPDANSSWLITDSSAIKHQKIRIKTVLQFTVQPFLCSEDHLESSIPPQLSPTLTLLFLKFRCLSFDLKTWRGGKKEIVNIFSALQLLCELLFWSCWFANEPPNCIYWGRPLLSPAWALRDIVIRTWPQLAGKLKQSCCVTAASQGLRALKSLSSFCDDGGAPAERVYTRLAGRFLRTEGREFFLQRN